MGSSLLSCCSRWIAAALVVLASGCSGKETVHISLGKDATADAGAIELSFRPVHAVYERPDGVRGSAAPYVLVEGGWLEIVDRVRIARLDNLYELRRGACTTEERRDGDFIYRELTGCDIDVESLGDDAPELVPFGSSQVLNLADRNAATKLVAVADGIVAVRSTGFQVGNVLPGGPGFQIVESMNAGLDIITSYGVKNLDYDGTQKPIIGHEQSFELGPQRVFVKIVDVGNTNTRCDGGCRNVLDVEVRTEPLERDDDEEVDISVDRYQ